MAGTSLLLRSITKMILFATFFQKQIRQSFNIIDFNTRPSIIDINTLGYLKNMGLNFLHLKRFEDLNLELRAK